MPIYEYGCEKCGSRVEVLQKVSDPPLKRCQKCRGKLEKIVSRTSFQLKGGGWYKTDYSHKSSSKSSDKAEKVADKKPDKKPESASSSN
jgi:putative FmdB family regulatory protein